VAARQLDLDDAGARTSGAPPSAACPAAASSAALDADVPMMSAGVNSIAAVRLASKLRSEIGLDVPATLIFEHPTPRAVSAHLESLGCAESLAEPNAVMAAIEDVLTSMASPMGGDGNLLIAGTGIDDEWLRMLTHIGSTPEGLPMSAMMLRDCQVKAFHMQQLYQLQPEDSVPLVSKSLRALSDVHHMLRSGHTPPLFWVNQARLELDVVAGGTWEMMPSDKKNRDLVLHYHNWHVARVVR